jgi:hypothetical protein
LEETRRPSLQLWQQWFSSHTEAEAVPGAETGKESVDGGRLRSGRIGVLRCRAGGEQLIDLRFLRGFREISESVEDSLNWNNRSSISMSGFLDSLGPKFGVM